jgi:hypothetical protein
MYLSILALTANSVRKLRQAVVSPPGGHLSHPHKKTSFTLVHRQNTIHLFRAQLAITMGFLKLSSLALLSLWVLGAITEVEVSYLPLESFRHLFRRAHLTRQTPLLMNRKTNGTQMLE